MHGFKIHLQAAHDSIVSIFMYEIDLTHAAVKMCDFCSGAPGMFNCSIPNPKTYFFCALKHTRSSYKSAIYCVDSGLVVVRCFFGSVKKGARNLPLRLDE